MRTYREIRDRVAKIKANGEDFFGDQMADLLIRLPREEMPAGLSFSPGEDYKLMSLDRNDVLAEMKDYMAFALTKAEDHRGLSASRSVSHYRAWIWLLGDEDFQAIDWDQYGPYGAPILKQICDRFAFEHPFEGVLGRMSQGLPCSNDCGGCSG